MSLTVTVRSCLPLGNPQGEFSQTVSEDMTVGYFIRKVCRDSGIQMRSSLTLRNSEDKELRWSSTLREAFVISGAVLMLHDTGTALLSKYHCYWNDYKFFESWDRVWVMTSFLTYLTCWISLTKTSSEIVHVNSKQYVLLDLYNCHIYAISSCWQCVGICCKYHNWMINRLLSLKFLCILLYAMEMPLIQSAFYFMRNATR